MNDSKARRREEADGWTGTPLDAKNVGCYLTAGTEVCEVGPSSDRKIAMMVSQQEVELIRLGQHVRVFCPSPSRSIFRGTVESIESSPVYEQPIEVVVSGKIPVDAVGGKPNRSLVPVYRVNVELEEERTDQLPVRSVGTARVQLDRCSVFDRVHRFISNVSIE